jgi:tryptophan-rich hypothetical protein
MGVKSPIKIHAFPKNASGLTQPPPHNRRRLKPMARKQKFPHLLGSKWTAREKIDGWRHFQVVNRKDQQGLVFAELRASCDPDVRFWLNAKGLKDRTRWLAGWQALGEIEATTLADQLGDRQNF